MEDEQAAAAGSNGRGLSRALIAVPEREDDRMWPVGASVIAGTAGVRAEIEAIGDSDPTELMMPLAKGFEAAGGAPCLLMWEGTLHGTSDSVWRGEYRLATAEEFQLLQAGELEETWDAEVAS